MVRQKSCYVTGGENNELRVCNAETCSYHSNDRNDSPAGHVSNATSPETSLYNNEQTQLVP